MQVSDIIINVCMEKETAYYNSGVLLINSKELWHDGYHGKLKGIIFQNKIKYELGNQDVLNDVFSHKAKPLSISWNCHHDSYFTPEMHVDYIDCNKDKFIIIMNGPYIRHFTSPRMPWLVGIKRKMKNEYLFYERLTPFYKIFKHQKYKYGGCVRKAFSIYDKLVYLKERHKNYNLYQILGLKIRLKRRTL